MAIRTETRQTTARRLGRLAGTWPQVLQTWWMPAVLIVGVGAVNLLTLARLPAAFVDEGWNANRSWAFLHTGYAFGSLDAGVMEKYPGYLSYFPFLGTAIHSVLLAVFGPTLLAMRLASLLFGLALLVAIYIIGRRLYNRNMGLLAVFLTSLSIPFVYSSHLGRHDIIITFLGFAAVALYLTDDSRSLSAKSVISGLAVGLTLDIHMNGLIYIPLLATLYLLDNGLRILRSGRFWGFVSGVSIGVAYFVIIHILPNPRTYFTLFSLGNGTGRTPPLADPSAILSSFATTFDHLGLLIDLVALLAFVVLLRKPSLSDKRVMLIFAVLCVAFSVVIRGKPIFYTILIYPAAALLAAALFHRLITEPWKGSLLRSTKLACAIGLVATSLVLPVLLLLQFDSTNDYQATLAAIRAAVAPGGKIIGPQNYWFARTDQNYLSWEQLIYFRRDNPSSTLQEAFTSLHPDYFIEDDFLDGAVIDPASKEGNLPFLYISKPELEGFLSNHAHLAGSIKTDSFGYVRIYRIDWNGAALLGVPLPDGGTNGMAAQRW